MRPSNQSGDRNRGRFESAGASENKAVGGRGVALVFEQGGRATLAPRSPIFGIKGPLGQFILTDPVGLATADPGLVRQAFPGLGDWTPIGRHELAHLCPLYLVLAPQGKEAPAPAPRQERPR